MMIYNYTTNSQVFYCLMLNNSSYYTDVYLPPGGSAKCYWAQYGAKTFGDGLAVSDGTVHATAETMGYLIMAPGPTFMATAGPDYAQDFMSGLIVGLPMAALFFAIKIVRRGVAVPVPGSFD